MSFFCFIVIYFHVKIHHDPEYYPEPEKFDPDRFSSEAIKQRDSMTWLPFGDGNKIKVLSIIFVLKMYSIDNSFFLYYLGPRNCKYL